MCSCMNIDGAQVVISKTHKQSYSRNGSELRLVCALLPKYIMEWEEIVEKHVEDTYAALTVRR